MTDCPMHGEPCRLEPVTLDAGGRIGWWCHGRDVFIPDGDYVKVLRREVKP